MGKTYNGRIALSGNEAAAFAMKQIEPDVVAAYPITPQTDIVMNYSQYVADGEVMTEMIPVESEHSAMGACVGSSAAGARTMTATSANGLALMWEIIHIAASTRLPIVMPVVNRALSAPINIHCDHSDSMGARDSGWIQIYCENPQEVYENIIMAVRISEHPEIMLPVMVCQDGFITSHAEEPVNIRNTGDIRAFVGEYKPGTFLLDTKNPSTYGPLDLQDYYFEHKRQQSAAMNNALSVIPGIFETFERSFGRRHDFVEPYMIDDAETAIVALGSSAGTAKHVVDTLREKGEKVGLLKPCFMRPFPAELFRRYLLPLDAVAVLDRSESFSTQGGPLYNEIKSALYASGRRPPVADYIYGLGGRELTPSIIENIFNDLAGIKSTGILDEPVKYAGVRE